MLLISQSASVISADLTPLSNTSVTVGGANGEAYTTTDSLGIFTITRGLGPGDYVAIFYRQGYVSRIVNVNIASGAETNLGDIGLAVSGKIQGNVKYPDGAIASNITVQCRDESDNIPVGYTVTSGDGSFTFDTDIHNGTYTVETLFSAATTSPAGYASNKTTGIKATEGQTTSGVVIQLIPSGTISGTVKDINNATIPDVTILAGTPGTYGGQATTNSQGKYTIDSNMPTGNYTVYILNAKGYAYSFTDYRQASVTAGQTTTLNFTLETSGAISGTVTLKNGAPAPNITVSATSLDYKYSGSATTDSNGYYRIDTGLAPRQYQVIADGNATSSKTVNVEAGVTTPNVNFQVSRNLAWISGTVRKSIGGPLNGAVLRATAGKISGFAEVENDGKYMMKIELPEGQNSAQINITASARGYISSSQNVTITLGETTNPINFTLQQVSGATLRGRVVVGYLRLTSTISIQSSSQELFIVA